MKVLIVSSYNNQRFAPFITEQVDALRASGFDVDYFGVKGNGIKGYMRSFPALKTKIQDLNPDVIHAHYGLCGLLANLQRRVPVVTTYHGSDINLRRVRPFSRLSVMLSSFNIFVSRKTLDIIRPRKGYALIPCGVDLTPLQLTDKAAARRKMELDPQKEYVLFSGAFDNTVKNYPLAKAAVDLIPDAELMELKGYSREQVTLLMCAADALILTSFTEGSPQVVKEAMACGCPVVSVDVGDVKDVVCGVDGCYICERSASELAGCIKSVLLNNRRIDGRKRIQELCLDNADIAKRLISIYEGLLTA